MSVLVAPETGMNEEISMLLVSQKNRGVLRSNIYLASPRKNSMTNPANHRRHIVPEKRQKRWKYEKQEEFCFGKASSAERGMTA